MEDMNKDITLEYYDENAESFKADTVDADMNKMQNEFLAMLPKSAHILDLGCGSGRDSKYFLSQGFEVIAVDGSREMCRIASEYTGLEVRQLLLEELDYEDCFDGVWACASLLHIKKETLVAVLKKITVALKHGGILYASFKYGSFSGFRNGRYYTDLDEPQFEEILSYVDGLDLIKYEITNDVRPNRGNEKWLNVFLKKG